MNKSSAYKAIEDVFGEQDGVQSDQPADGSLVWMLDRDGELVESSYIQVGEGEPFVFDEPEAYERPAEKAVKPAKRNITYFEAYPGQEPFNLDEVAEQPSEIPDVVAKRFVMKQPKNPVRIHTLESYAPPGAAPQVSRPQAVSRAIATVYPGIDNGQIDAVKQYRTKIWGLLDDCVTLAEAAADPEERKGRALLAQSLYNVIMNQDQKCGWADIMPDLDNPKKRNIYQLWADQVCVDHYGTNGDFSLDHATYVPITAPLTNGAKNIVGGLLERVGKTPKPRGNLEYKISDQPELLNRFLRQIFIDEVYELP